MPEGTNFADRLVTAAAAKAPVVVGIDPVYRRLPAAITEDPQFNDEYDSETALDAILEFCRQVIRTVAPQVPAVKINSAYFERYYGEGIEGYYQLIEEAAGHDLLVIGDVKRGDVGHSSEAYAAAHLGDPEFENLDELRPPDAVTVSGYLGLDAIEPFRKIAVEEDKGLFVLVRTSNPSAAAVQDATLDDGRRLCELIAAQVTEWGAAPPALVGERGYSSIGAVVAPPDRPTAARLREILDRSLLLVPGWGAQGADRDAVAACFKPEGTGAVVSASRSVIYAYEDPDNLAAAGGDWLACINQACTKFAAEVKALISGG